jgi:hypothetical protein
MLLWAKAAQRRAKQEGREMTEEAAAAMGGGGLRPEQLDQVRAVPVTLHVAACGRCMLLQADDADTLYTTTCAKYMHKLRA